MKLVKAALVSTPAALAVSLFLHLWLIWFGLHAIATPMGDITNAYEPWYRSFVENGRLLGINEPWVYPFLALPAILVPGFAADLTGIDYQSSWLAMSVVIDLVALWFLLGRKPSKARLLASYSWIGMQFMLGPVAISRLDNISVALAVIAISALVNDRQRLASVWLTIAVWVKIWPVALLLGLTSASAFSFKKMLRAPVTAIITSITLVAVALLTGGNGQLFSFLAAQTDRGIQVEAPVALPWLWQQVTGAVDTGSYYSMTYLTFQVKGQGVELVAQLMSYALLIALAITAVLAYFAGKSAANNRDQVLSWVALTATLDLMVFNKVGSPQYQAWLIAPVLFAILKNLKGWRNTAISIAVLMPLTWLIYPVCYDSMLRGELLGVAVLTMRNLLLVVLLVVANTKLTKLAFKKLL